MKILLIVSSAILILTCLRMMNHMCGLTTRRLRLSIWMILLASVASVCLAHYQMIAWPTMLVFSVLFLAMSLWLLTDRREVNQPPPIRDISHISGNASHE